MTQTFVYPSDSGRITMKSMDIPFQGLIGTSIGSRSPYFLSRMTLFLWQESQGLTYSVMCSSILGQKKFALILPIVFYVPKCPAMHELCSASMIVCLRFSSLGIYHLFLYRSSSFSMSKFESASFSPFTTALNTASYGWLFSTAVLSDAKNVECKWKPSQVCNTCGRKTSRSSCVCYWPMRKNVSDNEWPPPLQGGSPYALTKPLPFHSSDLLGIPPWS